MRNAFKGQLRTDAKVVDRIVSYLRGGKCHREIHQLTGVSTVTISSIRTKYAVPIKKGKSLDNKKYRSNVGNRKRFEEIKGALLFMATKKVRVNEDIWDLVNDVWIQGVVQSCPQKALFKCISWGIGGYRRERDGTRNKNMAKIKNAMSIEQLASEYRDEPFLPPVVPVYFMPVDSKDYFDFVLKDLTRTQKLILKLRFFEDMSQSEMAKVVGCSQTLIGRYLRRSLSHIQEVIEAD